MRLLHASLLVLPLAGVGACHNACQDLCKRMYDYAAECGYTFPQEQLKACYADMSRKNTEREDRRVCREYKGSISDWWDCDDIARYFDELPQDGSQDGGGSQGGEGGDTGDSGPGDTGSR